MCTFIKCNDVLIILLLNLQSSRKVPLNGIFVPMVFGHWLFKSFSQPFNIFFPQNQSVSVTVTLVSKKETFRSTTSLVDKKVMHSVFQGRSIVLHQLDVGHCKWPLAPILRCRECVKNHTINSLNLSNAPNFSKTET